MKSPAHIIFSSTGFKVFGKGHLKEPIVAVLVSISNIDKFGVFVGFKRVKISKIDVFYTNSEWLAKSYMLGISHSLDCIRFRKSCLTK